ncbi:hypothetical protein GLOIN_2v1779949 [Rhizophagus irregularis DAOM 181602=DAOM 197198]|uniref:Serine/threonine-protein kinase RIO1 n=1 Tax=Rhizophagus irregularis (strain DAOM 181602 / DAOM 197198 / MUCL 43194) TaxID=747089 RepID=A0A2P4PNK1_RHIID|nr:hypothetical protein GLOIN_2v1779949 [Rhizophagus irregularis DAOM 181602=DAOM 197198]POG66962.1 hypothetical protein GLOIN_2v1779949 [Rhizophagus irregularis DAOM 181602=DAOM 197198]|eukprot:XP_025173828.1 hypothetical protein GLOIN_2v1779949 [Rhizophagus irregularis DAOM 181602=DAOM 197198]
MPDIIYTLNYVPGQFDDTPENEQDEQRITCGTLSGSIKYQQGPSEGSSLSAGRGVSDEAKKKNEVSDGKLSVFCQDGQQKKTLGDKQKNSDKSDRATVEQVLDPRTRIILFKMINRNANVYHAITEDGNHRAIKVYETSILVFKDRDRYVTGEFGFRHGYSKHNPRKMVKLWAEKEMRNLKRLWQAGIPCPEPLVLGLHALVMIFLGDKNGWYVKEICFRDLSNVTEYFKRKGVRVIGELFDFITDINIGLDDEQVEAELDKIQERLASQQELSITLNEDIDKMSKDLVDEEVFKKAFIPRTLNDVFYVERDTLKVSKDEGEDLKKIPNENEVMVKSENVSSISTKDDEDDESEEDD